ncbi:hypothetical protein GCM10020255_099890 [Rhodococcus baikonurensis]
MTWRMPAESEPHERTWMAYPSAGYSLGDTAEEQHEARSTWAAVAHAVAEFEPVTVVVDPAEVEQARKYLSGKVDIVEAPLDDAWMRDIGPTFVLSDEGRLGGVDWMFNGWGAQDWAQWDKDSKIGRFVVEQSGAQLIDSPIVNEGGGIAVDGLGTVLVTETVQLDPGRNPDLTKADIEAELARTIGAKHVIWLPRGLTRDQETYGTRGHVDIVAAISSPEWYWSMTSAIRCTPTTPSARRSSSCSKARRTSAAGRGRSFGYPLPKSCATTRDSSTTATSTISWSIVE